MVPAVHWTTRQRGCFQEGNLTCVCPGEQNIALMSKEVHRYTQQLVGHLAC